MFFRISFIWQESITLWRRYLRHCRRRYHYYRTILFLLKNSFLTTQSPIFGRKRRRSWFYIACTVPCSRFSRLLTGFISHMLSIFISDLSFLILPSFSYSIIQTVTEQSLSLIHASLLETVRCHHMNRLTVSRGLSHRPRGIEGDQISCCRTHPRSVEPPIFSS